MKTQIYAIFDQAAGIYQKPFFGLSDGEVKRSFMDVATAADHPIAKHPEDYTLYRLGNFDDNTGLVQNEENESLCTAQEIISQAQSINPEKQRDLVDEINQSPGLTQ